MTRRNLGAALLLSGGLAWLAGCSGGSYEKYIPTESKAREALRIELEAWKKGEKPGQRKLGKVALVVFDAKWQAGQKLADYEIIEEEQPGGPAPRWFKVRLTMTPSGQVMTRYAVMGDDPLQVYREEDFKKLNGAGM